MINTSLSEKKNIIAIALKEPATVEFQLRRLINGMEKRPAFISSDRGNEMTGVVNRMLERKGIIHRAKTDKNDMNSLSIIDRVIQNLRKRLAENLAKSKGEWVQRLHVVTSQYNKTIHPTIRSSPSEFGKNEQTEFMALADNAKKLRHWILWGIFWNMKEILSPDSVLGLPFP